MVQISISYDGSLRCTATHGPSSTTLATDAPKDNMGRGESYSPTDLVATALASCALTTMAIAAQREGYSVDGASASIEKQMAADPHRRISGLPMRIRLPASLTDAQRRAMEAVARGCPVARSLHADVEASIEFEYDA